MQIERAIRTIRKSLEQLYMLCPTIEISKAIQIVVTAHNLSPSRRNPILRNGIHASPKEVLKSDKLSEEMEKMLRERRQNQYTQNLKKKVIMRKPKFKVGETV